VIALDALGVHVAVLHPPLLSGWLAGARDIDQRLETAARVMDMVGASDPGTIVAFPAGFLRAGRLDAVDELAAHMLALARQNQVAVAFGVQLDEDERWAPIGGPPRLYGFVCDGGRRLLWPTARDEVAHVVRGHRIGVLVGREAFRKDLRAQVARASPAVILALTNLGPTGRWRQILRILRGIAPTIVVGESTSGGIPDWAEPPGGWRRRELGGTGAMTVVRYEPLVSPVTLPAALLRDVGGYRASMED
jgi:hypothetical protein